MLVIIKYNHFIAGAVKRLASNGHLSYLHVSRKETCKGKCSPLTAEVSPSPHTPLPARGSFLHGAGGGGEDGDRRSMRTSLRRERAFVKQLRDVWRCCWWSQPVISQRSWSEQNWEAISMTQCARFEVQRRRFCRILSPETWCLPALVPCS